MQKFYNDNNIQLGFTVSLYEARLFNDHLNTREITIMLENNKIIII